MRNLSYFTEAAPSEHLTPLCARKDCVRPCSRLTEDDGHPELDCIDYSTTNSWPPDEDCRECKGTGQGRRHWCGPYCYEVGCVVGGPYEDCSYCNGEGYYGE